MAINIHFLYASQAPAGTVAVAIKGFKPAQAQAQARGKRERKRDSDRETKIRIYI